MSDYGMQAEAEMWDAIASQPARYVVKCDECKTEIRRTDSVHESACGGYCDTCRAALDARYPERVANRERSTRRERLEARAERRHDWAASREAKSAAALDRVHQIADGIPFGQPILVGHHSEAGARADQRKMENGMRAAVDSSRMAEHHEQKAQGLERQLRTSIFSDDTDAVEQLAAKIARLEGERDRIKAYNASCRKGQRDTSLLDERQQADLAATARACPYQIGKRGEMPSYVLTNLGGNITRNKKRLEQITLDQAAQASGTRTGGRPMASRYSGTCPDCGEDFDRGAAIVWFRATREAVCAGCVS